MALVYCRNANSSGGQNFELARLIIDYLCRQFSRDANGKRGPVAWALFAMHLNIVLLIQQWISVIGQYLSTLVMF
jgi:hypothetical protein